MNVLDQFAASLRKGNSVIFFTHQADPLVTDQAAQIVARIDASEHWQAALDIAYKLSWDVVRFVARVEHYQA